MFTPRKGKRFPFHIIVFLAPAVIIYTTFMIYPLVDSLRLGFFAPAKDNIQQEVFVGFDNYKRLLTDKNWAPRLEGAIKNNIIFFIIHMCVQNPIGLLLATLLSSQFVRGRAIYRTLIFTPTILSFVLVGFIWTLIFNPLWGISEDFFMRLAEIRDGFWNLMGPLDVVRTWFWDAADWVGLSQGSFLRTTFEEFATRKPPLGLKNTALPTVSLISVWQFVGIPMMLFLAALISIPEELIEAARVDGATAWGVFWRIKFPLILPTVGIVGVLTFVGNFNAFDLVYTMKGGLAGPDFGTDLLGTFFHRTFFGFQLQSGNPTMGAAIAGVMFLIILAGILLYLFGWQRRLVQVEF